MLPIIWPAGLLKKRIFFLSLFIGGFLAILSFKICVYISRISRYVGMYSIDSDLKKLAFSPKSLSPAFSCAFTFCLTCISYFLIVYKCIQIVYRPVFDFTGLEIEFPTTCYCSQPVHCFEEAGRLGKGSSSLYGSMDKCKRMEYSPWWLGKNFTCK